MFTLKEKKNSYIANILIQLIAIAQWVQQNSTSSDKKAELDSSYFGLVIF